MVKLKRGHDNRYLRRDFVNGTIQETFNALVTSNGSVVTMTLTDAGAGSFLTMQFSDAISQLDVSSATITLTAGSDASPTENYIYIPQSTKVLTLSTSDWPSEEHIKISYFLVPSAGFVQNNGVYVNQNWNDHLTGTDSQGHMPHIAEVLRRSNAKYFSGIDGNGTDDYLTPTAGNVELISTAGIVYQLHKHTVNAFDTSAGDTVLVKNWSGDAYHNITNLYDIVDDSTGATIGNNKYFNLVLWSAGNKTGEYSPMIINLPSGSYNTQSAAENDTSGYDDFDIPREFVRESSTGFMIARMTIQMKTGGGTWVVASTVDLRGQIPSVAKGGASGVATDFADNTFSIFDEADNTKELNFDVGTNTTTGTTRTLQNPDANGIIALTSQTDGTIDHGADIAGLGDDDHTQYLLADGTRALGGAWNMGSQIITNANIDTGDIATAVTNTEWDAAFTHVSSDGSDHSFINQDVTSGSSPTFTGTNITGIDISAGTNLAVTSPIVLTDDTLSWDFSVANTWTANQTFSAEANFGNANTFIQGSDISDRDLDLSCASNIHFIISGTDAMLLSDTRLVIGTGAAGNDYIVQISGESNTFTATWMEDEAELVISDTITMDGSTTIQFDDSLNSIGKVSGPGDEIHFTVNGTLVWELTGSSLDSNVDIDMDTDKRISFRGNTASFIYSSGIGNLTIEAGGGLGGTMIFNAGAGAEYMRISNTGVVINEGGFSTGDFRVETDNFSHMIFSNAGTDSLTFGSSTELAFVGIDGRLDEIQFLVQANSTQNTDIFVVEASDGTDYFAIESDGTTNIKGEAAGQLVAFVYNQASPGSTNQNMRWGNVPAGGASGDGIIMPSAGSVVAHTTSVDITSAVSGDVTFEVEIENTNASAVENEFAFGLGTGRATLVTNVARNTGGATFSSGDNIAVRANETGDMAWDDVFGVVVVQLDT